MFSRTLLAAVLLGLVIIEATPTERELKQNKVPLISDDDEPPAASGELANFSGDGSDEIEDQTRFVTDEAVRNPAGPPHELPVLTPTLASSSGNREAYANYLFSPTRPLFAAPESSDVRNPRQPTPVQLDPNLLINQYAAPHSKQRPHNLAAGVIPGSHGQAVGLTTAQHQPYYRPPTGVQSQGKPRPVLTAAAPRPPPAGGGEPHAHSHSIVPPSEFFNGINVQQPPKTRPKPHSSFIPPKNTAGANYPTITGGQQGNVGQQHTSYFPTVHAQGNPYPEAQQQCQSATIASRGLYDQIEHIAPACRRSGCGASCESKAPDFMLDLRTKKISYSQFYSDGRYVFPPNYWRRSAQIQ